MLSHLQKTRKTMQSGIYYHTPDYHHSEFKDSNNQLLPDELRILINDGLNGNLNGNLGIDDSAFTAPIFAVIDARGLACPLPLIKFKLALKAQQAQQKQQLGALYLLTDNANSVNDLTAFCQARNLSLHTFAQPINNSPSDHTKTANKAPKKDTIMHCFAHQKPLQ